MLGEVIKNLNACVITPFWNLAVLGNGGNRLDLLWVLMELVSELDENSSIFLTMNNISDSMYCECRGRIFNFLKSSWKDTIFPVFIIILIVLFCNLNIVLLLDELP